MIVYAVKIEKEITHTIRSFQQAFSGLDLNQHGWVQNPLPYQLGDPKIYFLYLR